MNDQQHQAPQRGVGLGERRRQLGIAIAKKVVVRIDHFVIVVALIRHWILASRRNHRVFDPVPVEIAEYGRNFWHQRESIAKLLVHKIVVDLESGRLCLTEGRDQERNDERQERECFCHASNVTFARHRRQVTKVTTSSGEGSRIGKRPRWQKVQSYKFPAKCSHPPALRRRCLPLLPITRMPADRVIPPMRVTATPATFEGTAADEANSSS